MEINIFDVSHGFCAYIESGTPNVLLLDCGNNPARNFYPSSHLPRVGCTAIELLIVSNMDEDHVADLPNLLEWNAAAPNNCFVRSFKVNTSITPDILRSLKEESGGMGDGVASLVRMIEHATYPAEVFDFGALQHRCYWNEYGQFTDTNNLSVVTFVEYDGLRICFPGDLEVPGWRELLKRPQFCEELREVGIFVASHHGRESGLCEEVFAQCSPQIIIISDEEIKYDSQDVNYARFARGIPADGGGMRKVFTTRSDGDLEITKSIGEDWRISTSR